ncbi:MAG: hypothetical protein JWM47_15 [Acidimicrobiales bacterium]|nr:hypothetical protein [Acidimicrobiales bacterium]
MESPEPPDRYRPRFDVHAVSPQAPEVAERCPLRVQFDAFPPEGVARGDPSAVDRLRIDDSRVFVARVFAALVACHPGAVRVDEDRSAADQEAATVAALAAGAPLVLAGRLPVDEDGRRRGRPDVLARAERRPDGGWGYHPLAIRHRKALETAESPAPDRRALVASIEAPAFTDAEPDDEHVSRLARADLLLLAHHHRLLEAAGHGSPRPVGAVIGREERAVWVRLDQPVIRQRWDRRRAADETALERYDFEFSFRLDVLAAAAAGTPLVEPVWIGECATCPWVTHCRPRLEAADSVSLMPGMAYQQWRSLRRVGITTRAELAALDQRSAVVRDAFAPVGDLADAVERAGAVDPATPIADLLADTPGADGTAIMATHGITTAADLLVLDPVVVALAGQAIRSLGDAVQGAHAVVHHGGRPVLRHGRQVLVVPTADVEIDIDMENGIDGSAYLWGALVDGRYHPTASWKAADRAVEAAVFVAFWDWLGQQRAAAAFAGRSLVTFCWYRGAESRALRNGAEAAAAHLGRAEAPAEVEAFLSSDAFVDLWEVFTTQLVTGGSHGLKTVAALAGFSWRDADPDGALSMVWHAQATTAADPATREAARARLLAYNEDDVRATAAVRRWLRDLPVPHVSLPSAP